VSPLALHSSSALGSGRLETNEAKLAKNEDKSVRHALTRSLAGPRRKRRKIGSTSSFAIDPPDESSSESDGEQKDSAIHPEASSSSQPPPSISSHSPSPHAHEPELPSTSVPRPAEQIKSIPVIGGALARNPDGTIIGARVVFR
jgi:ATP-dependent RNA helicase DHX37/DHR1